MKFNYKVKRVFFCFLIILCIIGFFLGLCLVYPDVFWDVSFLGYELSFGVDNLFSASDDIIKDIPSCPDCNVILISLDTLRADRLGCYGYNRDTSPNIDKLAEESILFENAFSNAYHTTSSHMSIFTSQYPNQHKIEKYKDPPLTLEIKTLAETLKSSSYKTIWSGPLEDPALNLSNGFGRGFDEFYPAIFSARKGFNESLFFNILKQKSNKTFLFIHSYTNHGPYIYPGEFNSKFSNQNYQGSLPKNYETLFNFFLNKMKKSFENDPDYFFTKMQITPEQKTKLIECLNSENLTQFEGLITQELGSNNLPGEYYLQFVYYSTITPVLSEDDVSELSNSYDNGVYYIDFILGEFLDKLKQGGLLKNTVIIITSDHGEELFEHKGFDHDDFYDHTIHVPFIIKIPGLQKKIEVSELSQSIDILPITLDLLGIKPVNELQGKNLMGFSENNDKQYVFGYSFGNMYVKSEKWKYIKHRDGEEELYYLLNDPLEKHNLINSKSLIVNNFRKTICDELIKWETSQF